MAKYSHSQIQTYLSCPLKFCLEKIEKIKPDIPNESLTLVLGTAVHKALEELYIKVSNYQKPEKEWLLDIYKQVWNKEIEEINKQNERELFDKETLETFYNRGVEYINYYYDTYKPFTKSGVVMKTESNVFCELEEWIKFSWKIDRIDIDNDIITIVDYKTNKTMPKDWKEDTIKNQITLYGIWIKKDYESKIKKIIWRVEYLHLKKAIEWEITNEEIEKVKQEYLQLAKEIEQKKSKYEMGNKEIFQPKANNFCDSCLYKQLCPLYSHLYNTGEEISMGELWTTTIRKLIDNYKEVYEKEKMYEEKKKLYWEMLLDYAKKNNYRRLYGEETKLSITRKIDYWIDKEKKEDLKELLKEKGILEELLDIDRFILARKIKSGEIPLEELNEMVGEKEVMYFSKPSKLKENEGEELGD